MVNLCLLFVTLLILSSALLHRLVAFPLGVGLPRAEPKEYFESGMLTKADTLAELAQKIWIDPNGLEETVKKFNQHAFEGKSP